MPDERRKKPALPRIPERLIGKIKTQTITDAKSRYSRGKFEDAPMDFVAPALNICKTAQKWRTVSDGSIRLDC